MSPKRANTTASSISPCSNGTSAMGWIRHSPFCPGTCNMHHYTFLRVSLQAGCNSTSIRLIWLWCKLKTDPMTHSDGEIWSVLRSSKCKTRMRTNERDDNVGLCWCYHPVNSKSEEWCAFKSVLQRRNRWEMQAGKYSTRTRALHGKILVGREAVPPQEAVKAKTWLKQSCRSRVHTDDWLPVKVRTEGGTRLSARCLCVRVKGQNCVTTEPRK